MMGLLEMHPINEADSLTDSIRKQGMSDPLAKAAAEWFQKGTEAMGRENWDFAVECFGSAVKMKPDVVLYRQTKHGCSRKRYAKSS